jgi:hypothetical protein
VRRKRWIWDWFWRESITGRSRGWWFEWYYMNEGVSNQKDEEVETLLTSHSYMTR